ncbi:phospholipase C type enzyme [Friedmanniomyces endolithicus]|nr:phospholipase C type enzyme [Friedmanniomyces endolithicus]
MSTYMYLPIETYDEILAMIATYNIRERKQRRLRLTHFVVELFVALGCFVAVWWSPHNFVAFLLMLLSTLGLSAGVLDGLMGGLFVGSEIRALKEFEYEVRNAREQALLILDPYKSAQESSTELDFPLPRPLCSATPRVDTIEARSLQLQHPFQEVR